MIPPLISTGSTQQQLFKYLLNHFTANNNMVQQAGFSFQLHHSNI